MMRERPAATWSRRRCLHASIDSAVAHSADITKLDGMADRVSGHPALLGGLVQKMMTTASQIGRERRSLAMSDKEKTGTAWHEAGHAYLNMVLPDSNPLHKVTIIPRGPYLGEIGPACTVLERYPSS